MKGLATTVSAWLEPADQVESMEAIVRSPGDPPSVALVPVDPPSCSDDEVVVRVQTAALYEPGGVNG